jgi:hypothetical protein
MLTDLVAWLAGAGSWAFRTAVTLFLILNVAAIAFVAVRRDRAVVNRWTSPWLAANLALLGLGAGVPLIAALLRVGLSLLPSVGPASAAVPK